MTLCIALAKASEQRMGSNITIVSSHALGRILSCVGERCVFLAKRSQGLDANSHTRRIAFRGPPVPPVPLFNGFDSKKSFATLLHRLQICPPGSNRTNGEPSKHAQRPGMGVPWGTGVHCACGFQKTGSVASMGNVSCGAASPSFHRPPLPSTSRACAPACPAMQSKG